MKYFKRLKIYKNHNGNNTYNPETKEALSYKYWYFVKKINNFTVFNCYSYSNTTSKHQSHVRSLMSQLRHKIDYYIECPEGLQHLDSGIEYYKYKIQGTIDAIKRPKSQKAKNLIRAEYIKDCLASIELIEYKLKPLNERQVAVSELCSYLLSMNAFCDQVIKNGGKE